MTERADGPGGRRPRVLLVASTTGYQVRSFESAARRRGVDLILATDRCHVLDDPWRDGAIPVRFEDVAFSVGVVVGALAARPVDGVLAVGDHPSVVAAAVAEAMSLSTSPLDAVRAARSKLLTRICFRDAGLPCPWFVAVTPPGDAVEAACPPSVAFPCVVKPLALSASRGVIRVDTEDALGPAIDRAWRVVVTADTNDLTGAERDTILVEGYVPGREVAVEGILTDGHLKTWAVFDKPDPLEGPFFEETIYVTPSRLASIDCRRVTRTVAKAAAALGLTWGPIHAECRLPGSSYTERDSGSPAEHAADEAGVVVLEVANRPIGGLCARVLRFDDGCGGDVMCLEDLILRQALGESVAGYQRETCAAGVMMIPIAMDGVYKRVEGLASARAVTGVDDIVITAKPDQRMQPLPEGSAYLGFIFARGDRPSDVVTALRAAHDRLQFHMAPVVALGSH